MPSLPPVPPNRVTTLIARTGDYQELSPSYLMRGDLSKQQISLLALVGATYSLVEVATFVILARVALALDCRLRFIPCRVWEMGCEGLPAG
jgi:hypothetical protein